MEDIEIDSEIEGIKFRLAEKDDIVTMLAIERDVYEGEVPWTFSHFEYEIVQNNNAFFIAALKEGNLIGFIGIRMTNADEIHISNLAVFKKEQKKGVATALISQVIKQMKMLNKKEINLEAKRENTLAQGLYRRLGFETEKILTNYYEDGSDAVWMVKRLKAAENVG